MYIYLNEFLTQKFSEFLMHLNCLLENASISGLSGHQKLANACTKRNKNIWEKKAGCRAKVKFIHFAITIKMHQNFWEFLN